MFGLGCAVMWSVAVLLFKGVTSRLSPNTFNLVKNAIALCLMTVTLPLLGGGRYWDVSLVDWGLLFLSGVIGLGFADTLFLYCLKHIGAGWTAVVEAVYTPFVFFLSIAMLGESVTLFEGVGILVVITSVLLVQLGGKELEKGNEKQFKKGVLAGVSAIFLVAVGVVMTKYSLARVDLFYAVEVRLIGGVVTCFLMLLADPHRASQLRAVLEYDKKAQLVLISFVGTYLTLILWIAGFKFHKATVVAVLNQTSTIFTMAASIIILKEKYSRAKLAAGIGAFVGVFLTLI